MQVLKSGNFTKIIEEVCDKKSEETWQHWNFDRLVHAITAMADA